MSSSQRASSSETSSVAPICSEYAPSSSLDGQLFADDASLASGNAGRAGRLPNPRVSKFATSSRRRRLALVALEYAHPLSAPTATSKIEATTSFLRVIVKSAMRYTTYFHVVQNVLMNGSMRQVPPHALLTQFLQASTSAGDGGVVLVPEFGRQGSPAPVIMHKAHVEIALAVPETNNAPIADTIRSLDCFFIVQPSLLRNRVARRQSCTRKDNLQQFIAVVNCKAAFCTRLHADKSSKQALPVDCANG